MLASEQLERKVHGSSGLLDDLLKLSTLEKYSPESAETVETIVSSGDSKPGSLSQALQLNSPLPSRTTSDSLASLDYTLEPKGSRKAAFLSCFGYGASSHVITESDHSVSSCEVGIRPSFYWLDSPVTEEQRQSAEASARFLKSDCQDDALVIENFNGVPGLTFVGVFDGHGPYGRMAAKFASTHLPRHLSAQAQALRSKNERKRMSAIREACIRTDEDMNDTAKAGFDCSLSGTTACFAVIHGNRLIVANVGDSRCVVAKREPDGTLSAMPLTLDAKPFLPDETKRIQSCGGLVKQLVDEQGRPSGAHRVFRRGDDVLPGLAMSRSLGDSYAHTVGVSAEPTLTSYTLTHRDQFLMLGTDGLWDVMTCSVAADFVERYRCNREAGVSCAEALTLEAQERWKAQHDEALVDDISVAILHLTPLPPPERTGSIPRPLARAASCNDEANAMASSWHEGLEHHNPSHHSPQRFFSHLWSEAEDGEPPAGVMTSFPPDNVRPMEAVPVMSERTGRIGSAPIAVRRASRGAGGGVGASLPERFEGLLRPIRKAYPSSGSFQPLPSWDPSSFKSEGMGMGSASGDDIQSPRSSNSDNPSGRGGDHKCRRGDAHEGKVRGGIPKSVSTGQLHRRASIDSESTPRGNSYSRHGSMSEFGLASVDETDALESAMRGR